MDELDRLYVRLVQNIRAGFPELLTRPFEVSQLYLQVIPYRTNRRELGFDSNEEYELAVMQLLAGLRGYVSADADMQRAMRQELASPNPDLTAYRVYATAAVSLAPDALRALERRGGATGGSASTPGTLTPGEQVVMAARATETMEATGEQPRQDARAAAAAGGTAPPPMSPRPSSPPPPTAPAAAPPAAPPAAPRSVPASAAPTAAPASPAPPVAAPPAALAPIAAPRPAPAPPTPAAHSASCGYCGSGLPEGRRVTFCPACGHNLTVQHCPACATELEVGWKFCITCGRQVGAGPTG